MNIVLVSIDGLGVGEMPNANIKSNTWNDIVKNSKSSDFKFLKTASQTWKKLSLDYIGADSYLGHLTMSGIKINKLSLHPLAYYILEIKKLLKNNKLPFKINQGMIEIKNKFLIYDNFEANPGLAINIAGIEDQFSFNEQILISKKIRNIIKNPRLISFTAKNIKMKDYLKQSISNPPFFGILTPKTGVYNKTFKVIHLPFINDFKDSFQYKFACQNWQVYLYGKFANIIKIENNNNIILDESIELKAIFLKLQANLTKKTLHCINIQQTDLAGHAGDIKKYILTLNAIDYQLEELSKQDNIILIITSDHGNNPTIKDGKHNREYIPFWTNKKIPNLKLLSDVAHYLNKLV